MVESSTENEIHLTYFDEFEIEDCSLIAEVDQSDDETLISIPPVINNRNNCSSYWLQIFISCLILCCLIILSIIVIIFTFRKESNISNVSTQFKNLTEDLICKIPSISGKICSYKIFQTLKLISFIELSENKNNNLTCLSSIYIALSKLSIVTFSISKYSNISLINISMIDNENKKQLIEDGNFQSGTTNSFCVCGSSILNRIQPILLSSSIEKSQLKIENSIEDIYLSQTINTIPQQKYNLSFSFQNFFNSKNSSLSVYISSVEI